MTPFLKWAGGKRNLAAQILRIAGKHHSYHEPFLGGGAVALAAMEGPNSWPGRFYLTDANEELAVTWLIVRDDVEELIEHLKDHEEFNSEEYFYETVRPARYESFARHNKAWGEAIETAARMIYLNRTCFRGLYRVSKKSGFNVSFGNYKKPEIVREELLREISRTLNMYDTQINHAGFRCADKLNKPQSGDLVYYDPPYVKLSKTANFTGYTAAGFGLRDLLDLKAIAEAQRDRGVKVILSNHDTPEVREIFEGWRFVEVDTDHAINPKKGSRKKVGELLIVGGDYA